MPRDTLSERTYALGLYDRRAAASIRLAHSAPPVSKPPRWLPEDPGGWSLCGFLIALIAVECAVIAWALIWR